MIVWINGAHGVGKTTTSRLLQPLLPDARILDAEKVREVLMDIEPGLPATDNFQHWDPWRQLVVETASRVLDYSGGILIMPMTVLVESYWQEISAGLAERGIGIHHFVLHADEATLHDRIRTDQDLGASTFRSAYVNSYDAAAREWLHAEAEVIDTTGVSAGPIAQTIADAVLSRRKP